MKGFDEHVPAVLRKEQQWFGSIIGRPIDEDSKMNPISPSGNSMEEEAALHIAPSPTLRPAQRIQIYNQQYWWRLLNTLHESFPLLTRLFGYYDFNRTIGIPFLTKYPPRHWSLTFLGDRLPRWCREQYEGKDKDLIVESAELDWAFTYSFVTAKLEPVREAMQAEAAVTDLFEKKLFTQPYLYLLQMKRNLFKFREEFVQHDPDHWLHHPFPEMEKGRDYFFVIFRNPRNDIVWKEIAREEYYLLQAFGNGALLEDAFQSLEELEGIDADVVMGKLQGWFQEWTLRGWLTAKDPRDEQLISDICISEVDMATKHL